VLLKVYIDGHDETSINVKVSIARLLDHIWPIMCWWDVKPYSINQSMCIARPLDHM